MQLHSMALLEDCESIQLSIMHVVDGLIKGTLDPARARLIIQALRIAARNAQHVRFDDIHYRESEPPMVREVPNYAEQYLIEHPEFGPPLHTCGAGAPAREAKASPRSAGTLAHEAATNSVVQIEAQADPQTTKQIASQKITTPDPTPKRKPSTSEKMATAEPAAKRRQNTAHGASRGIENRTNPAPKERKNPRHESADDNDAKEYARIQQAEAAIPGALAGNWRDLKTVFEFAGICQNNKAECTDRSL
jgi:hypothetical protein